MCLEIKICDICQIERLKHSLSRLSVKKRRLIFNFIKIFLTMFHGALNNFNAKPPNVSEVTLSDVTGSSELLVPGRVVSSNHIPQGAMSMPIEPTTLKGLPHVVQVCTSFLRKKF